MSYRDMTSKKERSHLSVTWVSELNKGVCDEALSTAILRLIVNEIEIFSIVRQQ